MTRKSALVKVVVGVVALGGLAALFLRSVQTSRETPFQVERTDLAPWSLELGSEQDPLGAWLSVKPPAQLGPRLGRQIFARSGESVNYPNPASMPLLLRSEFDGALTGLLTPDAIMTMARAAGLESATFTPVCMGQRRVSEPGSTRGVFFVLFDSPAFAQFRQQVAEAHSRAGGNPSVFDPMALSPVFIVAASGGSRGQSSDATFSRWLPLRADPAVDCLASLEIQ